MSTLLIEKGAVVVKNKKRKGKRIERLEKRISQVFSVFAKLVIAITFGFALISIVDGLFDKRYIIEPIIVPASFEEDGITSDLVAWELKDEFTKVKKSGWSLSGLRVIDMGSEDILQDVVLFEISLNSIKSIVRHVLGIRNRAISGSLYRTNSLLYLKVAITGFDSITITEDIRQHSDEYMAYQALIRHSSIEILRTIDPFVIASYYWAKDQSEESIEVLRDVISTRTDEADNAYLIWGEMLVDMQQYDRAIEKFSRALEINPDFALAYNANGYVLRRMKKHDEAIKFFKKAVKLDSKLWDAWYLWGRALYEQQEYSKAIFPLKKAIETDRLRYQAYNDLSYTYLALGDLDSAMKYVLLGIKNNENSDFLHATAAEYFWEAGDKAQSFKFLARAQELGFELHPYANIEPYKTFLSGKGRFSGLAH